VASAAGAARSGISAARYQGFSRFPTRPPARVVLPELTDAEIEAELAEVDVLSLDIFDTALVRMVGHPTSVFEILEERLRPQLGNATRGLADTRFWAERVARRRALEGGRSQEIGLDDIYAVVGEVIGWRCMALGSSISAGRAG
jgi:hypothetical protein